MRIYNLTDNDDAAIVAQQGIFQVMEWKRDFSVTYGSAMDAYYASEMNVRRRQLVCKSQWQDRRGCAGGRHAVDRRPCRSDDRCEGRWRFHRQAGAWRGRQRVRGQAGIRGQWRGCARTDLPSCAAARSEPDGRRHHRERRPVLRLRNHDSAACGYGFASERDGGRRRGACSTCR